MAVVRVGIGALVLVTSILLSVTPADALSCVEHDNASPEAIIAGTERLSTRDAFFDRYDYAVLGTVTDLTTDESPSAERYGATVVTFDVRAMFGRSSGSSTIAVDMADPGWLSGYGFEVGTSYFVPIDESAEFESFVCDPISVVPRAGRAAESLIADAADVGLQAAVLEEAGDTSLTRVRSASERTSVTEEGGAGQSNSTPTVRYTIGGLAVGALLVLGSVAVVHRVRGRGGAGTNSR